MRFTTFSAVLATMAGKAMADFSVYYTYINGPIGGAAEGWAVFSSPPGCKDVENAPNWDDSDDVSGGKYGIRCEGAGCTSGTIEEMEMHYGDTHLTFYPERDHKLIDIDGNEVGRCQYWDGDFNCNLVLGYVSGTRVLWCETDLEIDGLGN